MNNTTRSNVFLPMAAMILTAALALAAVPRASFRPANTCPAGN